MGRDEASGQARNFQAPTLSSFLASRLESLRVPYELASLTPKEQWRPPDVGCTVYESIGDAYVGDMQTHTTRDTQKSHGG